MPSNLETYFGILYELHNIIIIILNVYFSINLRKPSSLIITWFFKDRLTYLLHGILPGLAFKMNILHQHYLFFVKICKKNSSIEILIKILTWRVIIKYVMVYRKMPTIWLDNKPGMWVYIPG